MQYFLCITLLILTSCSSAIGIFYKEKPRSEVFSKYNIYEHEDYLEQLASLAEVYINSPGITQIKLNKSDMAYLKNLYYKITGDNELLFKKRKEMKLYIIKNKVPFFFSLPHGQYFFSSGLITRYFKHEDMLISALTCEIFKVHYAIYEKKIIVPVGHMSTERMLSLVRLSLEEKREINKWAFYIMKRAGYDAIAYLNWLQLQNKNTLDFLFQLGGDTRRISREEFRLKNFIVNQSITSNDTKRFERNSSKGFYKLLTSLNKISYED